MSKVQRDKGKRGVEVVHILKDAGYDVARTPNSGGLRWKGDVQGDYQDQPMVPAGRGRLCGGADAPPYLPTQQGALACVSAA